MSQFSLFGAAAARPSEADLDGVVLAGGRFTHGTDGTRLSVVVADPWRADALAAEFAARGLGTDDAVVPAAEGFSARTAFSRALDAQAARWDRGASHGAPADFALTATGLRLWAVAAGRRDDVGFLLATPRVDPTVHLAAGATLARHGLAAVSLSGGGRPGWRISSARRTRRLAELIGPAPWGAGVDWPRTAGPAG